MGSASPGGGLPGAIILVLFQGCFLFTTVVATYTFLDLGGAQASLRFHDGLLAVHPLRLDPVQPGTLARQVADHDPYPAVLLRPPVVCLDPGPHPPAAVPGRVVPDQQQRPLAF